MRPIIKHSQSSGGWIFALFVGLVLAYSGSAAAQTKVSGQITESTTWHLAQSPFIVIGEIRIWNNSELTQIVELKIEPGVVVDLNGFTIRVGNQSGQGHSVNQGLMVADHVKFLGKGNVTLAFGKGNHLSNCVFDSVHLLLGAQVGKVSSGKIQDITMNHADITIYGGTWEIIGGKLINGTISYKALNQADMKSKEIQYMNFFMNMISLP